MSHPNCLLRLRVALAALLLVPGATRAQEVRPNILIAISDDQSFPHASAYGSSLVRTPAFDRVAREGVLFTNGFTASPGCSPSRAALLTGRYPWQLEHAGTHASSFPRDYVVFPDLLEGAGYHIGYTGKGWGPGDWKISGRTRNPAGPAYNERKLASPARGISSNDYAANFGEFLARRQPGQPFYFWYGASEPHRVFQAGLGQAGARRLEDVEVPSFLPDAPEIRADLLDYAAEIEWFDLHLARILGMLQEAGELDNTIVIVTSDNGMAFPRAKANVYEYGIHVPLAIRWGARVPGGRVIEDPVSLVDLAPTILEAAGIRYTGIHAMSGRSLLGLLSSTSRAAPRNGTVYAGRERHSSSRFDNLGYPQRAVRTGEYLYIRNFRPERWPAGAPRKYDPDGSLGPMHDGYHDIDAAPTLDFLLAHREDLAFSRYFHLAVDRRPREELYNIVEDPGCLINLALDPTYDAVARRLREQLTAYLMETEDPRVVDGGDVFETYPRYSPIRRFPAPEWAQPESPG